MKILLVIAALALLCVTGCFSLHDSATVSTQDADSATLSGR